MKVTSEDCVRWIVEKLEPTSIPEDWKRVGKRKDGFDVVRTFQNRKTGKQVEVRESSMTGAVHVKTGRTFRGRLTKDELAGAIAHAFSKSDGFEAEESMAKCGNDPVKFLKQNNFYGARFLTAVVQADLDVVKFDEENFEWKNGDGYCGCEPIVGFHTLPNGLTFLGITAGGDWETPLFYLLFWDGEMLRAYIPTDGNFWNTDTKTAYGSEGESESMAWSSEEEEENASDANLRKRFSVKDMQSLGDMDTKKILADIQRNIVPVEGDSAKPKGMADIDGHKIDIAVAEADRVVAELAAHPHVRPPMTMSSVQVIVQGDKLSPDIMPSATFEERLADVRKEAEVFVKELDELSTMNLDAAAVVKARQIHSETLRRIVNKYTSVVALIQRV